jgi:hypothetical protein
MIVVFDKPRFAASKQVGKALFRHSREDGNPGNLRSSGLPPEFILSEVEGRE